MSRVDYIMKNSAVLLAIQIGTTLLNFVSRTILIKTMGEQYLGINGLFGNILSMLSLAELGVGTTITYWLYEPMAKNDNQRLKVLMAVYKRIYNTIGVAILTVGIALAPFLSFFMKETPDIPHLTMIYVLYVVNMASSYFWVYKSALINVAQKNYIVSSIRFLYFIVNSIIQMIILLAYKNYIIYYVVGICGSVFCNITISKKAEKMYPYIKEPTEGKLTNEEKNEIKKDISAIFTHKIGSFVLTSTDNMIIAKFIGVIEVGLYSNYTMVLHAVQKLLNLLFGTLNASVGNLMNSEGKEKNYIVFKNVFFATSWLVGFCAVCLYILFNPFITLWLGEEYVFSQHVVFIIVFNFYLTFIRPPVNTFKHCAGLFRKDRYKPIFESIINLVVSIWLVQRYGILGVFIGTAVSTIVACMYVEPHILYKYYFEKNVIEYFKMLFKYVFVTVLSVTIIELLSSWILDITIYSFLYQILLCVVVTNMLFWCFFKKSSEMRYFENFVYGGIDKIKRIVKVTKS